MRLACVLGVPICFVCGPIIFVFGLLIWLGRKVFIEKKKERSRT